jgi:hypothetical protein
MRSSSVAEASLKICLISAIQAASCIPGAEETQEERSRSIEQPEEWSSGDRPSRFASHLERRASDLPASGEAERVPWPGSYWPTSEDSINFRWDGASSRSPAEKYEAAYGATGVEDAVSEHYGIDSRTDAKTCTEKSQCKDGEACAKRRGASAGRCIPAWFGICHGWAAAAVLFPEPQHDVAVNGVIFKIQDIKALLSLAHNITEAKFLSERCDGGGAESPIEYDEHGRPPPACRDSNAGTFHIVVANLLGLRKKSFVMDRAFDIEVWNQPIRGYSVVDQRAVTAEEANLLLGVPPQDAGPAAGYLFNSKAASLLHVKTDVSYIAESASETDGNLSSSIETYTKVIHYEYILELDADGLIIGGEWVEGSKRNHPDFLWRPLHALPLPVAGGAISHEDVTALAEASVAP